MIDKFCFITDTHFKNKTPVSRSDDYFLSLLKKLDYVIEFCKKRKIKSLLHGGDFFDSPFSSDYVAGIVAKRLTLSGLNVYAILGNHDITGKNADSYVNGKMHLYESYPWFYLIDKKYIEFDNCYITGFNYSIDNECPNRIMVDKKDKPVIALIHSMISEDNDIQIGSKFNVVSAKTIISNASIVLMGHYHLGCRLVEYPISGRWCNPGSFARLSTLENNKGIGPGLVYLKASDSIVKAKRLIIPHDDSVFSNKVDVKDLFEDKKVFELAMKELENSENSNNNVIHTLRRLEKNIPKVLEKLINKKIIRNCINRIKEFQN